MQAHDTDPKALLGDRGYDSDAIRDEILARPIQRGEASITS